VLALLWANSPWSHSYESVWTTKLSIQIGHSGISQDLRSWVNKGLMTFFFLVAGLEAKRELDVGSLRERRRVALPFIAALGGMAVPIAIYLAFNAGGHGAHGWGAAMSTDTAFALGVLALVAPGATRLRVRLLTIVVFDDLVALVVIATAYTSHVLVTPLIVGLGAFALLIAARALPAGFRGPVAALLAAVLWVSLYKSGIDPVIAGLAAGLVTTAAPPQRSVLERVVELTRSFREQPTPELARSTQRSVLQAISINERLQYDLHPWTSYVIVPLFALANAGVHLTGAKLSDAASSRITLGILIGYLVGKPVGIATGSWLASRPWLRGPRSPISGPVTLVAGIGASVGFTVSLLVSSLAFRGVALDEAKLGVLATVVITPALSWTAMKILTHLPQELRARQVGRTAEDIPDLAWDVDPARDHIRGSEDAPVTLVEYGDFQCPYCGQAEQTIRELLAQQGGDVRYVWRHLPLIDVHPNAQVAAEASEAAHAQGKFWDMYDTLLSHQGQLTLRDLIRHAEELGLDVERFRDELRRRVHAPRIAEDVASADESGVTGTPTFFINGRRHYGVYDIDALTAEVKAAKQRAGQLALARQAEEPEPATAP
jgi:Na+/H+ antiporter NhaA